MRVKTALTRRLPLLVYGAGSPLVEVRGDFCRRRGIFITITRGVPGAGDSLGPRLALIGARSHCMAGRSRWHFGRPSPAVNGGRRGSSPLPHALPAWPLPRRRAASAAVPQGDISSPEGLRAGGRAASQVVSSVYFDGRPTEAGAAASQAAEALPVYHARLRREDCARLVRVRW
jgi:hypothetical protein